MNIGFANIYSFRPHVEHLYYLSRLATQAGHRTSFLTCDASVDWCYAQGLKGTSRWSECPKCVAGGIRSYPIQTVHVIARAPDPGARLAPGHLAKSSACTLLRTETDADQESTAVLTIQQRLQKPVQQVYQSTLAWIEREKLDSVVCFNGRMELPQAVTQACRDAGINFLTHERTWFGDGLLLTPNDNCLGLIETHRMAQMYRNLPLTEHQARLAASLVARRFVGQNNLEWRVYNRKARSTRWPASGGGERYLVLPSSRNEFAGHPDWKSGWGDNTHALDDLISAQELKPHQLIVRCHPNWAESIGRTTGARSFDVYKNWCQSRGIICIGPGENASTPDLIDQSDIVVLNGGTAAIEAGVLGKRIISLGPANYTHSGIAMTAMGPQDLQQCICWPEGSPRERIRLTLRFIYMSARRLPQFNDFVQSLTTTRYSYFEGADAGRLDYALREGKLLPDDATYAASTGEEDEIIDLVERKSWQQLAAYTHPKPTRLHCEIQRRAGMRWVDGLRGLFKQGDR